MTLNSSSIRLSNEYKDFVVRLSSNRVIIKIDKRNMSAEKISDLIVRYFKDNNDRYLELINMEIKDD
tara:strand:+ start:4185 stop:4385 length:201 start_codon:yes stop_codon:yes gene_type:complete